MRSVFRRIELASLRRNVEPYIPYVLAIVVGLAGGVGAIVFREMIRFVDWLFFEQLAEWLDGYGRWTIMLIPALGGLIVGPLIYLFAREAKGHGVPEVMLAVEESGGRIRPRVAAVKALASAITIGSGGSAGREGPIVQIASTLGSTIGQLTRQPDDNVRLLVAAGAAAGVSATFNAPIAGVFFALEVILRHFNVKNFSVVVLSSVVASAIGHARFGEDPAFILPVYDLESAFEFPLYAALGVIAALVAFAFVILLYKTEDVFDALPGKEWLKPAMGGLAVGLLGLWYIDLFSVGYGSGPSEFAIPSALAGERSLHVLFALAGLKILATSLTIGSGGSGGVFAPSLFIGAMAGGAFGEVVNEVWPGVTAPSGAYAMVGMAAVFAGATRAPITAILILFEMTREYEIILPLMTAVVVATVTSQIIMPHTIYTEKLRRRGIELGERREGGVLTTIPVGQAMQRTFEVARAEAPASDVIEAFAAHPNADGALAVLDAEDNLFGIVTAADVARAVERDANLEELLVAEIATASPVTVYPDETLDQAVRRMSAQSLRQVPVVSRGDRNVLLGMLRRSDVFSAYEKVSSPTARGRPLSPLAGLEAYGTEVLELTLAADALVVGSSLQDIDLPPESVIVSIIRGGAVVIPRGKIELQPRDRLLVVTAPGSKPAVMERLMGRTSA